MSQTAKVNRHPDEILYTRIVKAIEGVKVEHIQLAGYGQNVQGNVPPPFSEYAKIASQLTFCSREPGSLSIARITVSGSRWNVSVVRELDKFHDTLVFNGSADGPDAIIASKAMGRVLAMLGVVNADSSSEEHPLLAAASQYQAQIQRLETVHQSILTDLSRRIGELESDFASRRSQLEAEAEVRKTKLEADHTAAHVTRMAELQGDADARTRMLDEREQTLEQKRAEIDDLDAKGARRKIRTDLKTSFAQQGKTFALTSGTTEKRGAVRRVAWLGLVAFLLIEGILLFTEYGPSDAVARAIVQTFSALGFGGMTIFLLRWENRWFQQHADEEFRLKRLELDFDRASWLVEMSLEYARERSVDLPPEVFDKLAHGLFERDGGQLPALHPADQLASALLGASAEAQLELPNGSSLRMDRRGLRSLRKVDDSPSKE